MFKYTEEEIINSSQRVDDEEEILELDLDKWIGVFWFGANISSQAQEMAYANLPRPERNLVQLACTLHLKRIWHDSGKVVNLIACHTELLYQAKEYAFYMHSGCHLNGRTLGMT